MCWAAGAGGDRSLKPAIFVPSRSSWPGRWVSCFFGAALALPAVVALAALLAVANAASRPSI